jgi:hypothetical protein
MAGVRMSRRNERTTAATIRALKATGKLELCDQALVGLCQTSAVALDEAAAFEKHSYAIARTGSWHLQCVLALLGRLVDRNDDDLSEMLTAFLSVDGVTTDGKGGIAWQDSWGSRPGG